MLFFLNTDKVSAAYGGGGDFGTIEDTNTKPTAEMANGLQRAAWVPISACVRTIS